MEWVNQLLAVFDPIRGFRLMKDLSPVWTLIYCLVTYTFLLLIMGFLWYFLFEWLGKLVRSCARKLCVGARLEDLIRLEASSARVESSLRWLGRRIVRSGPGETAAQTVLPSSNNERVIGRLRRSVLRRIWLMICSLVVFIAGLPGFFLSAVGLVVVVAAVLTAFPETVNRVAEALGSVLDSLSWSEATLATVAAAIPLTLVIARVGISERSVARRTFRRERDVAALTRLSRATPAIDALAYEVRNLMDKTIREFNREKFNAEEWYEWARRTSPRPPFWRIDDDHVKCDSACRNRGGIEPAADKDKDPGTKYSDEIQQAVRGVSNAWNSGLSEDKAVLARVMSQRAWEGLVKLWFCFLPSGVFAWWKLPEPNQWQQRRIIWQHQQLAWREPTAMDIAAGRQVAVKLNGPPAEQWLEEELYDVVWKLAELSRELGNLTAFSRSLVRPTRFERLARVSEG